MFEGILGVIGNLIKEFKYSFLIAFVVGIFTLIKLPAEQIEQLPFGKYNLLIAGAVIIFIYIVIIGGVFSLGKWIVRKFSTSSSKEKELQQLNQEVLTKLWEDVDSLSEDDRADLKEFLRTGNKPIPKNKRCVNSYSLFYSEWVDVQEKRTTVNTKVTIYSTGKEEVIPTIYTHVYKLKENIYQLLKYSQEHYGKISNFE